MKSFKTVVLSASIAAVASGLPMIAGADSLTDALKASKVGGNFNLRYEDVEAGSADSDGLTLRSRFTITTGSVGAFNAVVEFEDVRDVLGIDDEGGMIPDPETTELDQAFVQYKSDAVTAKVGRQVIALDGQRFVGHVGWRQDRQTFDAVTATFAPAKDLSVFAGYVYKRNRIFAETADLDSSDFMLNAAYKTSVGKLTGYAYLLDDEDTDTQSDTYGVSFAGATSGDVKFSYAVEVAMQSIDLASGADYDTDYLKLEGGVSLSGVTAKVGYEVLGSDDGMASFTTPLATLHKFNGWNDVFLGGTYNPVAMPNGLEDTYLSVGGNVAGVALTAVYHDFASEEGSTDYGTELDISAVKKFEGGYMVGVKYGAYDADNYAVDTDKLWVWVSVGF